MVNDKMNGLTKELGLMATLTSTPEWCKNWDETVVGCANDSMMAGLMDSGTENMENGLNGLLGINHDSESVCSYPMESVFR